MFTTAVRSFINSSSWSKFYITVTTLIITKKRFIPKHSRDRLLFLSQLTVTQQNQSLLFFTVDRVQSCTIDQVKLNLNGLETKRNGAQICFVFFTSHTGWQYNRPSSRFPRVRWVLDEWNNSYATSCVIIIRALRVRLRDRLFVSEGFISLDFWSIWQVKSKRKWPKD